VTDLFQSLQYEEVDNFPLISPQSLLEKNGKWDISSMTTDQNSASTDPLLTEHVQLSPETGKEAKWRSLALVSY